MFLQERKSGDMVEVLSVGDLINPFQVKVAGRFHAGEEIGDPALFLKVDLRFPSGEGLPVCWLDPDYRN